MVERNLSPNENLYYAALVDLSRKKLYAIKAWQAGAVCDFNLNNFQRKKGKKKERYLEGMGNRIKDIVQAGSNT